MNELDGLPLALLGREFSTLADERSALRDRHSEAWQALERAEADLPQAKERDRQDVAKAVREGKKRPEFVHTATAEKAIESAKADLKAIKAALEGNKDDVLAYVELHRTDLLHAISEQMEQQRSAAIEALEQLSRVLLGYGALDTAKAWVEVPTTPASGEIRPFVAQPFSVDARSIRQLGAGGRPGVPVSGVIDAIAERIEAADFQSGELWELARAAGLERVTSVERKDAGALALGSVVRPGVPQDTIMNIAAVGLCKFVIAKGTKATQLVVATETLATMSVRECLALNRAGVDLAFTSNSRTVFSNDPATRELVKQLRGDQSERRATERAEVVAESERYKDEQRALGRL